MPRSGGELPGEAAALAAFRDASRFGRRDGAGCGERRRRDPARRPGSRRSRARYASVRCARPRSAARAGAARCATAWSSRSRDARSAEWRSPRVRACFPARSAAMAPRLRPRPSRRRPLPRSWVRVCPGQRAVRVPVRLTRPDPEPGVLGAARRGGNRNGTGWPERPRGRPEHGERRSGQQWGSGGGAEDGTGGQEQPGSSGGGSTGDWYAKSLQACRDHRAGKLDKESEQSLIRLAKGEENLERFCDRLLDKPGQDGGAGAEATTATAARATARAAAVAVAVAVATRSKERAAGFAAVGLLREGLSDGCGNRRRPLPDR
ncbi:hypothetical protein NKH18_31825 [Streptomyces sp. M10(2022)]